MLKTIILIVTIFFSIFVHANDNFLYRDLAERIVGEYSSVVLLNLTGSVENVPQKKYHLFNNDSTTDTHASISNKLREILNSKGDINAMTSVHLLNNKDKRECVIVYNEGVDSNVIEHEAGHCFTPIRYEVPNFSVSDASEDYDKYLNELFADIAVSAISYKLNRDFSYIENRMLNIQKKGPDAVNYKLASRSFDGLKLTLAEISDYEISHEDLVKVVLEAMAKKYPPYSEKDYWINVDEYNKALQRTSR